MWRHLHQADSETHSKRGKGSERAKEIGTRLGHQLPRHVFAQKSEGAAAAAFAGSENKNW